MLIRKVIRIFPFVLLTLFGVSSSDWTSTAKTSISQTGFMFSYASSTLGSFNTTKVGHIFSTLTKSTARLAGFFGAAGALLSVIMAFIPGGDSAEIALMKKEFAKLSQKIDTVARSLEETKDLIKLETQKAAYLKYEQNIHYGYQRMQQCLGELENVACSSLMECKREKMLIAESYIKDMDVRKSMDTIFRGVTSQSTFGYPLLSLLKEQSKCNITKLNLFTNKITALITKGLMVSILHDLLTKHNYDYTDDAVSSGDIFNTLEKKRQEIQDSCFANFDYWLGRTVKDAYTLFSSDIRSSNKDLLIHLKGKYPWIIWHVFTYSGEKEPVAGPLGSARRQLTSSSKSLNVHSFVMPAINTDVEESDIKTYKWVSMLQRNEGAMNDVSKLERLIDNEIELKGQVQSFAFLPVNTVLSGYFKDEIKQQASPFNIFVNKPFPNKDIMVAVSFTPIDYPPKCSAGVCSNNGECFVFPYSTKIGCKCTKDFSGNTCETREENLKLKLAVNFLVHNTMKLPTFASIQHAIEDTQLYLKTSSENIQESIRKLGAMIDKQFKNMGEFISRKFDWFEVLMKYKDSIDNLYYFHKISNQKVYNFEKNNVNVSELTTKTNDKDRFSMLEDKDIARYLLSPVGIQKWLYHINFLIVGRNDSQFNSHKPLIFMAMDKYKDSFCFEDYKERISRSYRQLMLLQLRGFMLWSNAYSSDNRDPSAIVYRYSQVLHDQQRFLEESTCQIRIPNTKTLQNCTGGYYIHRSLDVSVSCNEGYFLKGLSNFGYKYKYIDLRKKKEVSIDIQMSESRKLDSYGKN